jgi:hypothetical protein
MDSVLESNQFSPRKIRLVNYCRLFLQVHTIANLAMAECTDVDLWFHQRPSASSPAGKMTWKFKMYSRTMERVQKRLLTLVQRACNTSFSVDGSFPACPFADRGPFQNDL